MKKALIIDDEPILNAAYCALLSNSCETVGALSAKEGLVVLKENTPDLILLDLNMPEMDGIGFLENADVAKNFPNTKVILFSVSNEDERIEKAFQLGAIRYVVKTMLSPSDLEKIISEELQD